MNWTFISNRPASYEMTKRNGREALRRIVRQGKNWMRLAGDPASKEPLFMMKEMNAKRAALGAFLLVLGATLIMAIPALFSQSGLGSIAGNYVAYVAALCVTISSIGGATVAYVLASARAKPP